MNALPFTKKLDFLKTKDLFTILSILLVILLTNIINFRISLRNARDNQRNLDISAIRDGLEKYKLDYGFYPQASADGKILACKGSETRREKPFEIPINRKAKLINLAPCEWGKDSLMDLEDINYPHYLGIIPKDPQANLGAVYIYFSNGEEFQILGAFEGKGLKEYDKEVLARKISCGIRLCNFGKASAGTPLDKLF